MKSNKLSSTALRVVTLILPLIIYRLTMSHEIGWVDSGLIAATAKSLGIANPPGFPTYMVIGNLFTHLPFGTIIDNLKLLSQLSAIGIGFILYKILSSSLPTPRRHLVASISSLSLLFSYSLWSQANNIETYTLTNLFLMIIFAYLAMPDLAKSNLKYLPAVAILGGIALGLNPMILCIIPSTLWWLYQNQKILFKKPVLFIFTIIIFISTIIITYSYLPLRAQTHPFINWGDPTTWTNIKNHLLGNGLNIYEPSTNSINGFTWEPTVFAKSILNYLYLAIYQFTPLFIPLIIWGGYQLFQNNKRLFIHALLVVLTNLIFITIYYGGNQESWMITSWAMLTIFIGYGLAYLPWQISSKWLIILPIFPLVFWYPILNHSTDSYSQDYLNVLYKNLPSNSVVIGAGDYFNSLSAYSHEIANYRTDITPITGNMFYIFPWYRENLRHHCDLLISQELENMIRYNSVDEFTNVIDQLIADNQGHNFFVTSLLLRDSVVAGSKDGTYHTAKYKLLPHGLLFQVLPLDSSLTPDPDLYIFPPLPTKSPFYLERNYTGAYNLLRNDYAISLSQLGDYYQSENDDSKAETLFLKSIDLASSDSSEFTQRLAIFYAQQGKNDLANKYFNESISRNPDEETIQNNYHAFLSQISNTTPPQSSPTTPPKELEYNTKLGYSFTYPSDWLITENNNIVTIAKNDKSFSIRLTKDIRQNITIDEYLSNNPPSSGKVINQGLAKIPNTDVAYVKVVSVNDQTELNFYLFRSNIVIKAIVYPADSKNMSVFDSIITSLKI